MSVVLVSGLAQPKLEDKVNDKKTVKRPDSTRTDKAKARTIARKAIRSAYAKNGGRF